MGEEKEAMELDIYNQFDMEDDTAIILAQQGKVLGKMVYDIPYRDGSGKCPKVCKIPGCYLDGKESHRHVTGIGIEGINEITRHMGGMDIFTIENQDGDKVVKVHLDGNYYFKATAIARDIFTGTKREATYHFPLFGKRFDMLKNTGNIQYALVITQNCAERNAAKKLLDQSALYNMAEIIREGRVSFNAQDVEKIFAPMYKERLALKNMYFKASIEKELALSSGSRERVRLEANVEAEVIDEPQKLPADTKPEKKSPKPKAGSSGPEITQPQKKALYAILGKYGAEKEVIKQFIEEAVITKGEASIAIGLFQDGEFANFDDWFKAESKKAAKKAMKGEEEKEEENPEDQKDLFDE